MLRPNYLAPLSLITMLGCAHAPPPGASIDTVIVNGQQTGIAVNGVGEAEAAPDEAVFQIGVEAREPSVEAARQAAASAQQAVLAALGAAGVASEDIKTTQLNVSPDYDYSEKGRKLKGYVVSNQVEVRVRDLTKLQAAIDGGLRAGGDRVRMNGVRFELSDPTAVEKEARRKAMEAARAKAEHLASLLGASVGAPLSVEDMVSAPGRPVMMRMEAAEESASADTPLSPGTTRVRVELRVNWAIAQ
jgi:uncharacterized protein YggE